MAREWWKPVPSHPGYEASNLGRIRSIKIHVLKPRRNHRTLGGDTHHVVSIGNRKRLVHRLVDEAFRGPRPKGLIVHHRDNDMINNKIGNLERVTYSQNTKYAYRDGRIGSHWMLNPFQRSKVVQLYKSGTLTRNIAKQFGTNVANILNVLKQAGVARHNLKKLTLKQYAEIRAKYIPYKYTTIRLAKEYGVSDGTIAHVLGKYGRGSRITDALILSHDHGSAGDDPQSNGFQPRTSNHPALEGGE